MRTDISADALILAAGSGERAGGEQPKQFRMIGGKPLLRHSAERLAAHSGIGRIWVVIGEDQGEPAGAALAGIDIEALVTGGATRRESVRRGLEAIARAGGCANILIHDAARPYVPARVIDDLVAALCGSEGAIPVLPQVDSLARGEEGAMAEPVDRENLWRVQTPQAFRFETILAAHRAWPADREASDDARIFRAAGHEVTLVEGDEALAKLTFARDFEMADASPSPSASRVGLGYDVHRLVPGEELWLAGIRLDHSHGLAGHSDADVALHAITDALLGAIAAGDIGDHFPPGEPRWKDARSEHFLRHACALARGKGFEIGNIDLTIICEKPRIGPHRGAMRAKIAEIAGLPLDSISVKATTTEGLGFAGRGEAIAAQAIASLS